MTEGAEEGKKSRFLRDVIKVISANINTEIIL